MHLLRLGSEPLLVVVVAAVAVVVVLLVLLLQRLRVHLVAP